MTNKRLLTEKDVDYLEQRFKGVFATKDDLQKLKDELMNKLDRILKEILASRQEQTVLSHQVSDHEDRISTLEEIHPDL